MAMQCAAPTWISVNLSSFVSLAKQDLTAYQMRKL